ncbi:hypothetical protein OVA24_00550 [Luteolibacter sp. SL250]|uniref:hypothetical protein n=1 Tax=Luteolibacter sp. SL250 TaxID=2995170 RepID=UPI002270F436|nr:hypothetical protein [Luteolibacter sp. SL250]WAC19865.1 hypothetical protein OVA24_00550 [Luteolibacter sp. SL250]
MKTHLRLLIPLVFSSTAPLHAALLVYDGFDSTAYKAVPSAQGGGYKNPASGNSDALFYDDDTNYKDGPEGSEVGQAPFVPGFAGAWDYTTNISSTVYARLEDSQLSYTGLTTTTGQLNLFRSGGAGSSKGFSRAFDVGPSTAFTNTLFIGGLIWRTAETSFYMDFNMTNGSDSRSFGMDVMADGSSRMNGYGADTATSASPQWATGTAE